MERIPSAQPPPACLSKAPGLEPGDLPGMDFAHMYQVYKSRRGIKRSEDSKETYKLPHRLIEKKRRDRINECIAQLKDLLPERIPPLPPQYTSAGFSNTSESPAGRESVFTLGAGSAALRKRYFQTRAFQRALPSQPS
uniref:Basic helix-loop-helix family member e40 n=1 Tax=Rousettus aegyptiacus TaxID=9407 RepID=A0A7J8HN73_ROUAE|nr:basic helix-loop-helix family member e40 [Rousettus aegyptiacus]